MMDQLIVKNIVKKYRRQTVLDNISFTLEPAKIYGLLGRNGAGKYYEQPDFSSERGSKNW